MSQQTLSWFGNWERKTLNYLFRGIDRSKGKAILVPFARRCWLERVYLDLLHSIGVAKWNNCRIKAHRRKSFNYGSNEAQRFSIIDQSGKIESIRAQNCCKKNSFRLNAVLCEHSTRAQRKPFREVNHAWWQLRDDAVSDVAVRPVIRKATQLVRLSVFLVVVRKMRNERCFRERRYTESHLAKWLGWGCTRAFFIL